MLMHLAGSGVDILEEEGMYHIILEQLYLVSL